MSRRFSRREVLRTLRLGLLSLPFVAALPRFVSAQQKAAQNVVQYQDKPKNGQKCADCIHFQSPNACKLVAGNISPDGWCMLFSPKAKQ